jgi:hypothetical protein
VGEIKWEGREREGKGREGKGILSARIASIRMEDFGRALTELLSS